MYTFLYVAGIMRHASLQFCRAAPFQYVAPGGAQVSAVRCFLDAPRGLFSRVSRLDEPYSSRRGR